MFNNIFFILHRPQLSENIGACARAIKNFNFSKLIVINPKPIYPNDKIIATSVGAQEIIKKSKVYDNLSLIHISEPTRLLSISYAVFCLKKKKKRTNK